MILYHELTYSNPVSCPYLPNKMFTQAYFFAGELNCEETELLFATGWRKFGYFFFRPVCVLCRMCIPVRIPVNQFITSKSQRRLLKKNETTQVTFNPLEYDDEVFDIYKEHSAERFGKKVDREEFKNNFCAISCPSLLSKYYVDGICAAAGFLDVTSKGLSSVYFVFRKKYQHLGLGKYSVLKEIEYSIQNQLEYYYLGYYVKGNSIMEYKTHFYPYECYDWNEERWKTVEKNSS